MNDDVDVVVDRPEQATRTRLVRYSSKCSVFSDSTFTGGRSTSALAGVIDEDLPRGNAERADQLIRAAESVVRNIAEGAGRWSARDSIKHYRIARGEAMECAASLDVLRLRELVTDERYRRGIELLEAVVAMLTKMI